MDSEDLLQQREAAANYFAMCLLMPKDFLIKDFAEYCPNGIDLVDDPQVQKLADRYRVSLQLMLIRLHQLELIGIA